MTAPLRTSVVATRPEQTFPVLTESEIDRVRPFGTVHSFDADTALQKIGDDGRGLAVVLNGEIEVVQYDSAMRPVSVVTYGHGQFMGELAQLARFGRRFREGTARGAHRPAGSIARLDDRRGGAW